LYVHIDIYTYCVHAAQLVPQASVIEVSRDDSSATLSCELFGYISQGEEPLISWVLNGDTLTGPQPVASVVSSLTIQLSNNSESAQVYSCSYQFDFQTIQLSKSIHNNVKDHFIQYKYLLAYTCRSM